jgi:hypothetical protein
LALLLVALAAAVALGVLGLGLPSASAVLALLHWTPLRDYELKLAL